MFCEKCGADNLLKNEHCSNCGKPFPTSSSGAVPRDAADILERIGTLFVAAPLIFIVYVIYSMRNYHDQTGLGTGLLIITVIPLVCISIVIAIICFKLAWSRRHPKA